MNPLSQLYELAARHQQSGNHAAAAQAYRQVLLLNPDDDVAMNNLGTALCRLGQISEGQELFRRAIIVRPDYFEALKNLGKALIETHQFDDAIDIYQRAIALRADDPQVHSNLGHALAACGRVEEAVKACLESVEMRPTASGYNNLGNALREAGDLAQSVEAHRQALRLNPQDASAHWNLALTLLLQRNFAEGWIEQEWRWLTPQFQPFYRNFPQPRWQGEELRGRRILLYTEQGFGDTIQFARYLPLIASMGGRPILECQPELVRLMQCLSDVIVIPRGAPLPDFDLHCPLLSLPGVFGTNAQNIPGNVPYLWAPSDRVQEFANRMPRDQKLKIGLSWAGNPKHLRDRLRSIALSDLEPLAGKANRQFFSLQKGEPASQAARPPPGMELIDWTAELNDFCDTAALIANLDLVITVDTAIAHLAGAIGKPVWVLLTYVPDWRWMLDRSDSPWYSTMRLFRQPRLRDWRTPVTQLAAQLDAIG